MVHILQLPRKLRDMIYTFSMQHLPTRLLTIKSMPLSPMVLYPGTLPALCSISKQLSEEATIAYTCRTRFVFADDPAVSHTTPDRFATFLSPFPNGLASVRMLAYQHVQQFGDERCPLLSSVQNFYGRPVGLVGLCSGLRSIMLTGSLASGFATTIMIGSRASHAVLSAEEMRGVFAFDVLFELRNLKHVVVKVSTDAEWARYLGGEEVIGQVRDRLAEILVGGFVGKVASPRIVVEVVDASEQ
jgi:hypothetical protein